MREPFERLLAARRGEPVALLHSCGRGPVLFCSEPVAVLSVPAGAASGAFARLDEFLREHVARRCVGWLGYDLGLDVEAWALCIAEDFPVPVLHVTAFDRVETFAPQAVPPAPAVERASALRGHTTRADYERRVAAVVEHIRAGDLFQANLTQPFTGVFGGDPRLLFWRLCAESPAPFCAYLEDGRGTAVLSSSPEEFLWREGAMVRTRPIKGTRPRHADALVDRGLLEELLASEKDQAELAMIVDLMRNDLGKVAEPGSVQVGPFPEHDSFAQVHHLLCTVSARLRPGVGPVDLLRATFPPGSVTGCPKLRCLEILEELELSRRGVYTGAIGWFGPGEALHLNVAIRTMVVRDGRVRANAGGGITAQSEPRREFEETLHKMAGLERALKCPLAIPGGTAMMGLPWWWIDGAFTRATPPDPQPFALLETVGAVKGMLPLWDRHLARLLACAQRLQRPAVLPPEAHAGAIDLLARNEQPDGVLRMLLTARGSLVLTTRARADAGLVRLIPVLARAPADAPPPDLKTTDRRHCDAALLEARAGGADDGVLLGQGGSVLETAIANLWLLLDGVWTTPPADGAILPGIARALLLGRARTQGIAVAERRCELGDLHRAASLAVSNAVSGVRAAALVGAAPGPEPVALQSLWQSSP